VTSIVIAMVSLVLYMLLIFSVFHRDGIAIIFILVEFLGLTDRRGKGWPDYRPYSCHDCS